MAAAPVAASRTVRDPAVSRGRDGHAHTLDHGTRIEAGIHLHEADPGLRIALEDRALDRRRAAPARQQRSMDVEAAVLRPRENLGGRRRPYAATTSTSSGTPWPGARVLGRGQCRRLENGDAAFGRERFDRRRRHFESAAPRPVGPRQDQRDAKPAARIAASAVAANAGVPAKPTLINRRAAASCGPGR